MLKIGDRLRKIFSAVNTDCIIVPKSPLSASSFFYITGLTGGLFEGCIAVAKKDKCTILSPGLDYIEGDELIVHVFRNVKEMEEKIRNLTKDCEVVGFDGESVSYSEYRRLKKLLRGKKFVDVGKKLLECRLTKDQHEIMMIKRSCMISDRVFEEVINEIREGVKEKDLALSIDMLIKEYGADGKAFESIVAFGKNSAIPHHVPSSKKLKRGEIVLLDFGARYRGYVSDITRSFVYGRANDKQKRMFEVVAAAQEIGRRYVKEGTEFEKVHDVIFRYIEKTKFKGKFVHSSGHTIGLDVHDGFKIGQGCKKRFSDGITFTLEPGIYLKSVGGIRIEDDFVFLNGRVKRLTRAPRFLEL